MNRLTINQLENYRNTYDRFDGIESSEFEKICDELIEYKALEEELGISLPILFKALKDGIYIKQDDVGVHSSPRLYFSYDYKCYCFEICFGAWVVKLKDYGKTWYLKEDLKSE